MFSNLIPCTQEIKSYPRLLPNNVEPMHPEYFSHVNIALGGRRGKEFLFGKHSKIIPFRIK